MQIQAGLILIKQVNEVNLRRFEVTDVSQNDSYNVDSSQYIFYSMLKKYVRSDAIFQYHSCMQRLSSISALLKMFIFCKFVALNDPEYTVQLLKFNLNK